MVLKPITIDTASYPAQLRPILSDARIFDSSCSLQAKVFYIEKDEGYFLKTAAYSALAQEAVMTRWLYDRGFAARVILYLSDEISGRDWLLTQKLMGNDCISDKYLTQPARLCDTLADRLRRLHETDLSGCPVMDCTAQYLHRAEKNYRNGLFDTSLFPDNWGYASAGEAYGVLKQQGHLLETGTLIHGDSCLPNIILDDWRFSGFIDLGRSGAGDRHIDIFWAVWSLGFNLKTDRYRQRFIDAYGRELVDQERLKIIAAAETFG